MIFFISLRDKRYLNMKNEKDALVFTDPCYIVKDGDWGMCNYGENLNILGFTDCICERTIYGDWSASLFLVQNECSNYRGIQEDKLFKLGNLCADAGEVCVVKYSELMNYNPDFFETHGQWTYAILPEFQAQNTTWEYIPLDDTCMLIGKGDDGKIKFCVKQTGA